MYCGTLLAGIAREEGSELDVSVPLDSVGNPASDGALSPPSRESSEYEAVRVALRTALSRSRGPFGPRDAPYRLLLMPSVGNREGAHWLMHRLADRVGIDLYTAKSHLNRVVPSFLAASEEREKLELMAIPLREAGLSVCLLERDKWLRDSLPVPVISASLDEKTQDCVFVAGDGGSLRVDRGSLSWASMARIEPRRPSLASAAEDDSRGAPRTPSLARDSGSFQLLDILRSDCSGALRLRADRFDFSCLGEQRTISAEMNLRRVLKWLSLEPERCMPLDECFRRVPAVAMDKVSDGLEGASGGLLMAREVEFTEYVLLLDYCNRELQELALR